MQDSDDVTPDQIIARLKSNRFLMGIPLAALVADLLVRTQSSFELSVILPFEAGIFCTAGIALFIAARDEKRRSLKTYRIEMWLGLAFLLGAIRDGLWATGMDISDVNIIDLGLGIAGCVGAYFWTNRESLRVPARPIRPNQGSAKQRV